MNFVKDSSYDFLDVIGSERKYWGEIDQKAMNHVNEQAVREGYLEALIELVRARPELEEYLLADSRIDWIFHCLTQYASCPARVLDIARASNKNLASGDEAHCAPKQIQIQAHDESRLSYQRGYIRFDCILRTINICY